MLSAVTHRNVRPCSLPNPKRDLTRRKLSFHSFQFFTSSRSDFAERLEGQRTQVNTESIDASSNFFQGRDRFFPFVPRLWLASPKCKDTNPTKTLTAKTARILCGAPAENGTITGERKLLLNAQSNQSRECATRFAHCHFASFW